MFIYVGKNYVAEERGKTLVGVVCDQCACAYCYELTRIGTGSATAPYYIGTGAAAQAAQDQSRADLEAQLAEDAEMVPCPKCNWINDELIQRYRRSRYRGWGCAAFCLACLAVLSSVLIGWILESHPPPSPNAVRFFYYIVPAMCATFVAGVMLLCVLLRSRIQPNRNYPAVPILPAGTPQALFQDASTERFVLARRRDPHVGTDEGWIYFFPEHDTFPRKCVDCLMLAHSESTYAQKITPIVTLDIPSCARCAKRQTTRVTCAALAAAGLILLAGGASLYWFGMSTFTCSFGGSIILAIVVGLLTATMHPKPWRVRSGKQPLGAVCLQFRNPEYARAVAEHLEELWAEEIKHDAKEPDRGKFKAMR